MPLDTDALARIVAQLVKEEVGKIARDDADIRAENAALKAQVDGLTNTVTALTQAVERKLDAREAKNLKGEKGDTGVAPTVDQVIEGLRMQKDFGDGIMACVEKAIDHDQVAKLVGENVENVLPTLIPEPIKGEKGDTGVAPTAADVAANLCQSEAFGPLVAKLLPAPIKGDKGDKGADAPAVDETALGDRIRKELQAGLKDLVEDLVPAMIPAPIKGDKGDKGESGTPPSPETITDQVLYDSRFNTTIKDHIAGLIPKPIAPNQVQVTEAVKAIYPSIRADILKALPPIEHKGVHEAGEEYGVGDEVIKNDSTYRAKCITREAPPHEDWQCIAKSKIGRKGPAGDSVKGDKGDKGRDGAGVKDIVLEEGLMIIELTDGKTYGIDFTETLTKALQDFVTPKENEDGT